MSQPIEDRGYTRPELLVSSDWLAERLDDPSITLVDCNVVMEKKPGGGYLLEAGRDRYLDGHIPGAIFLDLLADLSDPASKLKFMMPPAAQFADVVGAAGVGNDSDLILYSDGPNFWATRLFLMFKAFGHHKVRVLDGGWRKWLKEQRPISQDVPAVQPTTFQTNYKPGEIIGKAEVRDALSDDGTVIINALSPDMHSGKEFNAPYGRPGRIAGSVNVFSFDLVNPDDMTFLDAAELKEKFALSGALDADRVITYCGGGISATTDSFTLMLLGHDNVSLYDGSLTEWGPDETLPMESDF